MRKLIYIDYRQPHPLRVRLGAGVRAYTYGGVVKGTATRDSDLDVYVAGNRSGAVEEKYAFSRPLVEFRGDVYPMHVVGPGTVDESTFLASQPEAQRVI